MNTLSTSFSLDELFVEPMTGLVSGPGGREKLDPKVMDVLVQMAEHAGQVVLREDLMARLWPNVVVTDDAITRCFYELRRCLSHAGGDERYRSLLETVPKRGYRLNATVRPLAPSAAALPVPEPGPPMRRRSWPFALGALGAIAAVAAMLYLWLGRASGPREPSAAEPAVHAIAVLPFLDMSEKSDQRYLSDGVTEEILNRLSQSENLRVIARTSSFALRGETLDVPQIAKRLDVDYVLEGSVRRAGGRMRITAQLIDASTDAHVWSRTYDRAVDDLFAVEDEIASSVATSLQATLAGGRAEPHVPANLEAYENFLHGQFAYNRRGPGDIEKAMQYYRAAVELDPNYARAWAALAGAYSIAIGELHGNDNAALRALQGEAAREAVEKDPQLAVAHARLAQYYYHIDRPAQGDEHMRRAVALDPDDPLVLGFRASEATWSGDPGEAVRLWRRAVAQDPLSPINRGNLSYMLFANGQLEEALAEGRRALELNPGAGPDLTAMIACTLIRLGRFDEAGETIALMPPGNPRDFATSLLHQAPGGRKEADAALERLAAARKDVRDEVRLAEAYAWRGRNDEALDALVRLQKRLEQQRKRRDLWYLADEVRLSPYLRDLQADPRWARVADAPG